MKSQIEKCHVEPLRPCLWSVSLPAMESSSKGSQRAELPMLRPQRSATDSPLGAKSRDVKEQKAGRKERLSGPQLPEFVLIKANGSRSLCAVRPSQTTC